MLFVKRSLPTVTFATSCWERDWRQILLAPDYLARRQISHHCFPFSEKLLIINNVQDRSAVDAAAQQKVSEGILSRALFAEDIADELLRHFQLKREEFRPDPDSGVTPDWIYYNALAPLAAIYACRSEYLLYLTGDVRLDQPVDWIGSALRRMEKEPRFKVANLTWNGRTDEARRESKRRRKGFYEAEQGFSDQLFLVKKSDFCAPIYSEIREDGSHYPRGDVFEKRVFSAMKNRGWQRLTYAKGSYIHENF